MRRSAWALVTTTVLALAALGVAGYGVYQAGYRQGLAETADVVVPAFGYGFFPFGFFFGFIFLFLFFGLLGRAFVGRGWRGHHWSHHWDHDSGSPMEHRLSEWHEKAHSPGRTYRNDGDTTT